MRTQSPKCSFATALKWAMCARFFASKWRGITRSHVPVVSFQTISHLIEDSCFSKRAFTIAFFSGVAQHGGRGLGRLGIAGLGWPMRLPLVLLTSVLERTLTVRPVLRSFPLCTLLWCFAIFFITPVFSNTLRPISLAFRPIGVESRSHRVTLLAPHRILTPRAT